MAKQDNGESSAAAGSAVENHEAVPVSSGTAVVASDAFTNPGLPPHEPRVTDLDPAKERRASRTVGMLFILSIIGSILAIVAYIVFPIVPGDMLSVRLNTLFLGLGITLALIPLGIGAIYWAKNLMSSHEHVEMRHPTRGTEETRAAAARIFTLGNEESGFTRRKLIRNSLIGALAVFPLPAIVMFRDLAPAKSPVTLFKQTAWDKGTRLTLDPAGTPIKASDVTIGSVFHVMPEGIDETAHPLDEKAKAAVLLMRLDPSALHEAEDRKGWSYDGIVAYSKICTHVGCPVALYEQHTHHLLCPCHQSEFDVSNHCEVIFGPAARPLPQLPIAVDAEGYLVAQSDFHEPVGPSFWERSA
ncbi:Rieske 2Fe-2S domain-containing protein [Salinibacterium sp. dk2585]|uniref:cytochrome bc1 complex Rieske iron-sulfur subunit n=1 Tax=unclassified Salinibacterium TaxID=2632331 RepID=UPI0011C253BB|nr:MULTISPECIES: Rieske 2Fe-2S domain-containing protein [unclassified Salinibacterium]QEE61138.1 Rieske 2Fe-2S domain-containing protein [Salinibacterium sp. dk2585]TXK53081.1 Rieske 2Fe-2S domain-containing protein [Salinibacterium sp. dk5596]